MQKLTKKRIKEMQRSVMSFAGVGRGLWGNTPAEVDASIKEIHDLWAR